VVESGNRLTRLSQDGGFVVRDRNGPALRYVYFKDQNGDWSAQ
jgi:hypothetical protein